MDYITKYYNETMPSNKVLRLFTKDFSKCGLLQSPSMKQNIAIVLFYRKDCRFCQEFAPELVRFVDNYSKELGVKTGAVDMDVEENKVLEPNSKKHFSYTLGEYWPTVIIYYKGHPCAMYTSMRTAEGLKTFIQEKIGVDKECEFKFIPCD